MKKQILIVFFAFITMALFKTDVKAQVGNIVGTWKTIDDETGEAKSYVKIIKSKKTGKYFGKITKLLQKPADTKCDKCVGKYKDKKVVGMVILINMKENGDELKGGKILDPSNGKFYHCSMELDKKDKNKLNVRGSIDSWGLAGRTQVWYRLK